MATSQQARNKQRHSRAEQLNRVSQLRLAGYSDQTMIARELGVSQSTVSRLFAELDRLYIERAGQETEILKGQQFERCEALLRSLWQTAKAGGLDVTDRVLALLRREADLMGMDSPKKQEHTGEDGAPLQFTIRLGDVEPAGAESEA